MNKIVVSIILSIGAVVFMGYAGYWHYQANEIERDLVSNIDRFNAMPDNEIHLENNGIEQSGFPSHIQVAMKNPKVLWADDQSPLLILDGTLAYGFNISGALTYSQFNGQAHLDAADIPELPAGVYEISGVANISNVDRNIHYKEFFKNAFSFDTSSTYHFLLAFLEKGGALKLEDFTFRNPTGKYYVKDGEIDYVREDKNGQQQISLDVSLKDVTFKGPRLTLDQSNVDAILEVINDRLYQKMGNHNIAFQLECSLPDLKLLKNYFDDPSLLLLNTFPKMDFALKNVDFRNNLASYVAHALLAIKENDKQTVECTFDLFSQSHNKGYNEAIISIIDSLSSELATLKPENKEQKLIKNLFVNHKQEIKDLIPNFNELDTITFTDKGYMTLNKGNYSYEINLDKMDLTFPNYAIGIDSKMDGQGFNVKGEIHVNIRNMELLIKDLCGYANRVMKFLNLLDDTPTLGMITPELQNKVVAYLRSLTDDPKSQSKDITITFKTDGTSFTVGHLSMQDFIMDTDSLFTDFEKIIFVPSEG